MAEETTSSQHSTPAQPAQPAPSQTALPPSDKSRTATFLLSFFIGTLGIHRFYTGKTGSGVAMLLLSFSLIGLPVSLIWSFVDDIMILVGSYRDAEGRLVSEW